MKITICLLFFSMLLICVITPSSLAQPKEDRILTKLEVASASANQNAVLMAAWKKRDPELYMSLIPKDFRIVRPDGSVLTREILLEKQKQQMIALKHNDRMILTIEVESVDIDSAVVLSTQDWTRVVRGTDGKDYRFKTGVTHREIWKRADGKWKMEKFTEHNQTKQQLDDATIKDSEEHFEIRINLTDIVSVKH